MTSTGNPHYDAILERVAEIRAEDRLANPVQPKLPAVPTNFAVEIGDVRMSITFEPVGGRSKTAA